MNEHSSMFMVLLYLQAHFAEIKKFSWLNYDGFLKGKNQLKICIFLVSEPPYAETNIYTEQPGYSCQCLQSLCQNS